MRMNLDLENKIDNFARLGMTDPLNYNKTHKNAQKYVKALNFETDIYAGLDY